MSVPLALWWVISGDPKGLMEIDFQTSLTWASLEHPGFVTWPTSSNLPEPGREAMSHSIEASSELTHNLLHVSLDIKALV